MVGRRGCRGIGLGRMRIIGGRQSCLRMPERLSRLAHMELANRRSVPALGPAQTTDIVKPAGMSRRAKPGNTCCEHVFRFGPKRRSRWSPRVTNDPLAESQAHSPSNVAVADQAGRRLRLLKRWRLLLHRRLFDLGGGRRRIGSGWRKSRHSHHAVSLDLRQQRKLRLEYYYPGQIYVVATLCCENFSKTSRSIRLEAWSAEIAQDCVIAGLVALIQRNQRRADQNENTVAIYLRGFRRRLDRWGRRLMLSLRKANG